MVPRGPQLKPRNQLWCSGCAGQGHLEHECNYYNREYPATNPNVVSYEDVLSQANNNNRPPPPPPPVWEGPHSNNFPQMPPNVPQYGNPFYVPPLMSQIMNFLPSPVVMQQQINVPNSNENYNPNYDQNFAPAPTKVLNPFSVMANQSPEVGSLLNQLMARYMHENACGASKNKTFIQPRKIYHGTMEVLQQNQKRVRNTIMSMPSHFVRDFLAKEIADLENVVSHSDPKYLKKKLFKYDKISASKRLLQWDVVKERCFWYRILNMFIFGVHQFKDGRVHMDFLRKFVSGSAHDKLDVHKRKALLNAYNYIFEGTRHNNVNYYKALQSLVQGYNDGGKTKG